LNQQREVREFLKPVNYRALGLDDYLTIVKQPMDISTVKTKLKQHKYPSLHELVEDLQLIWDNCKAYNYNDHVRRRQVITRQAEVMERHMKSYIGEHHLLLTQHVAQEELQATEAVAERKTVEVKREQEPITLQDKVELSERVRRASHDLLGQIVKVVQEECPDAVEDIDSGRMLIKVAQLSRMTFDKIYE
jgi:plasmid stability protein